MSTRIVQIFAPSNPLQLRFDKVQVEGIRPLVIPVEFIALVDYDGEVEMEYAGILDGQMMLFHVDGHEVTIERYSMPFMKFSYKEPKYKQAMEGYGL